MNEKKKILILFCVFLCLACFVFGVVLFENNKSKNYLKEFYTRLNKDENSLIVVGRDNCSWCNVFIPIVNDMKDNYGFDYIYINTNKLTDSVLNKFLSDINVSQLSTPLTLVVNNGKVVDSLSGAVSETILLDFLKKYDFVEENKDLFINYIDYDEYKKLINSKKPSIIVVGQNGCTFCFKSIPLFNKLIKEKKYKINYLYYDNLKQEELDKFNKSLELFSSVEWGTPLTLIVKKGEAIDYLNGLYDYDEYIKLFEKNGL